MRADPRRRHDRRPAAEDHRAADQAGLALRVRSRHRRADLANRGAPGRSIDVPGEKANPTQKFVVKPPAYERQGVAIDDLIDFTPELRAEAVKLVSRFKIGPIFTPPVVSKFDGPLGNADAAGNDGGANWQGGSFDPETGVFYIFTNTSVRRWASCRAKSVRVSRRTWHSSEARPTDPANPKAADIPTTCRGFR